jgi:hypothetical protein
MNPAWVAVAITGVTIIVTLTIWFFRSMWRLFTRVTDFLADWNGRPGTPGHKRVPGAIERMSSLEDGVKEAKASVVEATRRMDDQDKVLDTIKHEVTMNSGGSLKDTVTQLVVEIRGNKKS